MEIDYYICEGCGRKVPDDLDLERCPVCGCIEFKSSLYPSVSYTVKETSPIDSHWDKGAYKTSREINPHKPIKPPEEQMISPTYFVCLNCIYCAPYEYPLPECVLIQYVCKKYPVTGELIENEELNWCGKGKWRVNGKLVGVDDIAGQNEKQKEENKKS